MAGSVLIPAFFVSANGKINFTFHSYLILFSYFNPFTKLKVVEGLICSDRNSLDFNVFILFFDGDSKLKSIKYRLNPWFFSLFLD